MPSHAALFPNPMVFQKTLVQVALLVVTFLMLVEGLIAVPPVAHSQLASVLWMIPSWTVELPVCDGKYYCM